VIVFTGIIAAVGEVVEAHVESGRGTYRFATGKLDMSGVQLGDSIAVNGACLTVVDLYDDGFGADLSAETLACTTLGKLAKGKPVNLERAMSIGDPLGGHLVTGHVDGCGAVAAIEPEAGSIKLSIKAPDELARFIAQKGSVCVDGVSLTVNRVNGSVFELMIVPHTQAETIVKDYVEGTPVNIEVDIVARYLERLMQYTDSSSPEQSKP
jgi:riboflavin synthase